jgi:hypothetical protein
VASEITKNGGIALCAPIAPYDAVRKQVRAMIEPHGGFLLVHVATPIVAPVNAGVPILGAVFRAVGLWAGEEGGGADVRLSQQGAQRPFGDVAPMTRDGGLATVPGVAPDLVAPLRLTVELEAQAT